MPTVAAGPDGVPPESGQTDGIVRQVTDKVIIRK